MPFVTLEFPPGVRKAGTDFQAQGRWLDAQLFRFDQGDTKPEGGWQKIQASGSDIDLSGPILGMRAWRDNDGDAWLIVGTDTECQVFSETVLTDITPAGFTTGNPDATIATLYGDGAYGAGTYGSGDPAAATIVEAQSWQFDTFGQIPLAWSFSDKTIYDWDLNVANNLVAVTNAPTNNLGGVFVTQQRHVVALGASGDVRQVDWSDKENRTTWAPASTNEAGGFPLQTDGEILSGSRGVDTNLIWTTTDLHEMKFIGGDLVFAFKLRGKNCGLIARRAKAAARGVWFWMGNNGFYMYNGFVQRIPCEIQDFVFSDMNRNQSSKFHAVPNTDHNEIRFYYVSSASVDVDRVAVFNYEENHWTNGYGPNRTAGVDRGVFHYPIMGDSTGAIYDHERGTSYLDTDDATSLVPYLESGPVVIGNGDRTMMVRFVIPDEDTLGSLDGKLFARDFPTATERDTGTLTLTEPTPTRISGRQVRLRVDRAATGARVGSFRLDVVPTGMRT